MIARIDSEEHRAEEIGCLPCDRPAAFEICEDRGLKIENHAGQQKVSDLRYSTYAVDHGMVECDFLDRFITAELAVLEPRADANRLSALCKNLTDYVVTKNFSKTMVCKTKMYNPHLRTIEVKYDN